MERRRRVLLVVLASLVTVGYAWWATSLRPFTGAALAATSAAAAGAVAVGATLRPVATPGRDQLRGGNVWLAILVAVAAWEVASFSQHPRSQHPTLSSLADVVLTVHLTRALAMAVWLALGVRIVRR